jgi:hypothetical protein
MRQHASHPDCRVIGGSWCSNLFGQMPGLFVACPLSCLRFWFDGCLAARTLTSRTAPAFFRPLACLASRVGLDTAGPEADFSPWGAITVCQMRANSGDLGDA